MFVWRAEASPLHYIIHFRLCLFWDIKLNFKKIVKTNAYNSCSFFISKDKEELMRRNKDCERRPGVFRIITIDYICDPFDLFIAHLLSGDRSINSDDQNNFSIISTTRLN